MPPEPGHLAVFLPLIALVALGACLGMALQRVISRGRSRAWRKRHAGADYNVVPYQPKTPADSKLVDAVEQLRIVMTAEFAARPLLNRSEARVFEELCEIVMRCNPSWRVMAQVSLGEILSSPDREAFGCINSKRIDMLLVDESCRPQHAIEYHGGGHYQGNAAARDAVKKEALRRAAIGYHEIVGGQTTPSELRQFVEKLVTPPLNSAP